MTNDKQTIWQDWDEDTTSLITRKTAKLSASAGTGKTYSILKTIKELIKYGHDPSKMMFLTLNKSISAEFKDKLLTTTNATEIPYMGTWHAVGWRLCKKNRQFDKHRVIGTSDMQSSETQNAIAKQLNYASTESLRTALHAISIKTVQGRPLSPKEQRLYNELLIAQEESKPKFVTYLAMQRELLVNKYFDPSITHMFVDEAQDMGWGHATYLAHIRDNYNVSIHIYGDEKQEVNGFLGADHRAFLEFDTLYRGTIKKTYRLPQSHLDFSNEIFVSSSSFVGLTKETAVEHSGTLEEVTLTSAIDTAARYAQEGKSVLFLSRFNSQKKEFKYYLAAQRVPFIDNNIVKEDQLEFAKEYARCLRLRAFSAKMVDMLNPTRGIGESGLLNVRRKKNAIYVDHSRREQYLKEVRDLSSAQQTILSLYENTIDLSSDIPFNDTRSILLSGFLPQFIEDFINGTLDFSFFCFKQEGYEMAMSWVDRLGEDIVPVELSSIHASKGLEADCVVLCTDTGGKPLAAESTDPDTERRIWYVGATRSKDALLLTSLSPESQRTRMLPRI